MNTPSPSWRRQGESYVVMTNTGFGVEWTYNEAALLNAIHNTTRLGETARAAFFAEGLRLLTENNNEQH